jgi:TRAP-type C4-dicarboxylate transport system permease small subunit
MPLTTFARIRRIEARLVTGMAYFCGALFLLLAFYTTYDVIARRYGGWYSGVTDEMSEYALALGASWALAYTLRAGGHVRVDILLPYLPGTLRRLLDAFAMAVMAVFAATVSVYLWKLVGSSYAIGATGHSIIQTPQWLPQTIMASGYSLLAVVAFTSCLGHLLGGEESAAQPDA